MESLLQSTECDKCVKKERPGKPNLGKNQGGCETSKNQGGTPCDVSQENQGGSLCEAWPKNQGGGLCEDRPKPTLVTVCHAICAGLHVCEPTLSSTPRHVEPSAPRAMTSMSGAPGRPMRAECPPLRKDAPPGEPITRRLFSSAHRTHATCRSFSGCACVRPLSLLLLRFIQSPSSLSFVVRRPPALCVMYPKTLSQNVVETLPVTH